MNNNSISPATNYVSHHLSAYELKLIDYMLENFPDRIREVEFIRSRAAHAEEIYNRSVKQGLSNDEAKHEADLILYEGIRYSPYQLIKRVLEEQFKVEDEGALHDLAMEILVLCAQSFHYYDIQDEAFPGSEAEDLLYTEITGTIVQYRESIKSCS